MTHPAVTTVTASGESLVTLKPQQNQCCYGRYDRYDPCAKDPAQKKAFGGLTERLRVAAETPPMDHDAAEAEAVRAHYAEPAGPDPPSSDPLRDGLFRGFWLHRERALLNRKT